MWRSGIQQFSNSTIQQFIVALALLGASGCATFRSLPDDFTSPWPPADTGPRPVVDLVVTGDATANGWPRDIGPILDLWGAATERAYRESALFSAVSVNDRHGDIRVEVALHANTRHNDFFTALSYLTLLIIPNVTTTDIAMVTRVTTGNDQPLGTVEVQGRSRTWYQILLFPIAAVYEPQAVTPEIVYDMSRETITTLHARGIF
jgi:hypothetical protein